MVDVDASHRELKAEEQLLNEWLYQQLRPRVVELLGKLRSAETGREWVEVHRELLIEFGARQDATDEVLPARKQEVGEEIRELSRQRPKPIETISAKQTILERVRRMEFIARASQHLLRVVGDGIAWRALGYDRRAFAILGQGHRVGRLAHGIGRDAEIAVLGDLWEQEGVFAIHNDLTNCLRHGDLTAIRRHENGFDVQLIEVKAGQAGDPLQMRRLERATRLLREGRELTDEGVHHLTVVPATYQTYLGILPQFNRGGQRTRFCVGPTPRMPSRWHGRLSGVWRGRRSIQPALPEGTSASRLAGGSGGHA